MELFIDVFLCSIPGIIICGLLAGGCFLVAVFNKIVFGIPIRKTMEELGW